MAGWIKVVVSTEVGFTQGTLCSMGTQHCHGERDGAPVPNFQPISIAANGWMHQDGTSHGGRPQPRGLCVR